MVQILYVVYGSAGDHEERREWLVGAYHSREEADKHAYAAARFAGAWRRGMDATSPYDPAFRTHEPEGGRIYAEYDVAEVPLLASFAAWAPRPQTGQEAEAAGAAEYQRVTGGGA
jgi:hypothetical protein